MKERIPSPVIVIFLSISQASRLSCGIMGNKATSLTRNDGEYEYSTAKRLLLSIKLDSSQQTTEAIEVARKECVKPSTVFASAYSYEDMVKKIYEYLTNSYTVEIDENYPRRLTPLQYAQLIHSHQSAEVIANTINDLQKSIQAQERHKDSSVLSTKDSLKNRQRDYDYTSKGIQPPPTKPNEDKISIKEMMKNSKNPSDRALEAKSKLKAFQETRTKK